MESVMSLPRAKDAFFAISVIFSIWLEVIPLEAARAVEDMACLREIAPSDTETICLANAVSETPPLALNCCRPVIILLVSAAFDSAVKAAEAANALAANVAYTCTKPPRPCACFAKSLESDPVCPATLLDRLESETVLCDIGGGAWAAAIAEDLLTGLT